MTAMQELIEIVEMDANNHVEISMRVFHKMLLDGLEKEKQQIIDAYTGGFNTGLSFDGKKPIVTSKDYYDQTFKNNKTPY